MSEQELKGLTIEQLEALIAAQKCGAIDAIERAVRGRIFVDWSRKESTEEQRDRLYREVQALERVSKEIRARITERVASK